MSKKVKELLFVILFCILNIAIAYLITTLLNVQNVILYKSLTAMNWCITYEVIIWFVLSFIEVCIYEIARKKGEDN